MILATRKILCNRFECAKKRMLDTQREKNGEKKPKHQMICELIAKACAVNQTRSIGILFNTQCGCENELNAKKSRCLYALNDCN